MWADLFATALWGESTHADDDDASFVEWRVSEGNLAYWETVPSIVSKQFGDSHPAYDWANHVLANLAAALAEGEALWRETPVDGADDSTDTATVQDTGSVTARYTGTVVVLTDGTCGSACLDAVSLLADLPDVVHVGSETAADTQYMESRPAPLPSGLATLVIPIKVYRGRVRPDGGYYTPTIRFEGLHWTDDVIRNWVLSLWHAGTLEASANPRSLAWP